MQDAQLISQAGQVESLASDGLVSVSTGAGQPQKNMELAKFADSLGSSVPLQQTSEQVNITGLYARTSDGKMVELTKESVASVMNGLMGNPLAYHPRLKMGDDLNNVKSGMYYTGGMENPKNCPAVYNNCIIQYNNSFSGGRSQILFSTDARQTFVRTFNSVEWAPWTRIDNFGYNTLAELSSGVAEQMGAPMMWKTTSRLESTKTPIPVNGGNGVHAYVYIISYNWSSDDATFYEYGIIRTGYSGNYVFKNIISEHKRDGTSFSVSSDSDGYVTINTTSNPLPNIHIRIMG